MPYFVDFRMCQSMSAKHTSRLFIPSMGGVKIHRTQVYRASETLHTFFEYIVIQNWEGFWKRRIWVTRHRILVKGPFFSVGDEWFETRWTLSHRTQVNVTSSIIWHYTSYYQVNRCWFGGHSLILSEIPTNWMSWSPYTPRCVCVFLISHVFWVADYGRGLVPR